MLQQNAVKINPQSDTQTLFDLPAPIPPHPAKYSQALYPVLVRMLKGSARLVDPFGGRGGIFTLSPFLAGCNIHAVEIEPEWASAHPRTTLGNALALPWPDRYFDAVCTSPCYGNRMADHFRSNIGHKRATYRNFLGRPLHPDNAGKLQWGEKYKEFHIKAWTEARRVLSTGGRFVLNIKDHIRDGEMVPVTDWHIDTLVSLGFTVRDHKRVETPGYRWGQNGHKRYEYESVILFMLSNGAGGAQ